MQWRSEYLKPAIVALVVLVVVGWINPFKNFQIIAFVAGAAMFWAAWKAGVR